MPRSIYVLARREDMLLCARVVDLDIDLRERVDMWNVLRYMFTTQI